MKIGWSEERKELTVTLELDRIPARWSPAWLTWAARAAWAILKFKGGG